MRLVDRLPDAGTLHRRRGAIAGFAVGALGSVVLILLLTVVFRGYGIADEPPAGRQVYTGF